MSKRRVAILFDIDGTLITSGGAGTRAWAMAFKEIYDSEVDIGELSDLGMTDSEVGSKSFESLMRRPPEQGELDMLLERRLHFLSTAVMESEGYLVLPGVEDLLIDLIGKGYLLGLVSGNSEKGAHIKLHRSNLNRFFSFGGYGSDSPQRSTLTKVAMERAEVAYGAQIDPGQFLSVGDTPRDVEAAQSVGISCVGVATSKFTKEVLMEAGATFAVDTLSEGLPL